MRRGSYAIRGLTELGFREDDIRGILRGARTLARLAEAQCNGDWPADHGDAWPTKPCGGSEDAGCGSYWHPSVLTGKAYACPDCRASKRITARIAPYMPQGIGLELSGDPRGYVVKVWSADGREVGVA